MAAILPSHSSEFLYLCTNYIKLALPLSCLSHWLQICAHKGYHVQALTITCTDRAEWLCQIWTSEGTLRHLYVWPSKWLLLYGVNKSRKETWLPLFWIPYTYLQNPLCSQVLKLFLSTAVMLGTRIMIWRTIRNIIVEHILQIWKKIYKYSWLAAMEYHRGGIFLTGLVMNAVQNETLTGNHWVNHGCYRYIIHEFAIGTVQNTTRKGSFLSQKLKWRNYAGL